MTIGFSQVTLSDKVAASLTRYSMLSPADRAGVAVSGGADSVALLHALRLLGRYHLTVLHVNHQLRGEESNADELFVRQLADQLSLPILVRQAPLPAGNLEQNARNLRRQFFAEARTALNLRCVALGHNQTDQAETVLYRFLRGSGLAGLAGMSPVTEDGLIRPLLEMTRDEIRAWAQEQGLTWREDSSNQNPEFVRNRLRLEFINPQMTRVLAATAGVARDEEAWWAQRTVALFATSAKLSPLGIQLAVKDLAVLHVAEQRRLLRHAIRHVKGDLRSIDLAHVDAIAGLLKSEAGHDRVLIPGVDALRSFGILLLATPGTLGAAARHYLMPVNFGVSLALPYDGGRLYVNRVKSKEPFCGNFGVEGPSDQEVVDLDGEAFDREPPDSLQLRNWEPGDDYRRAGHEKPEKIKSMFQDYRILLWERRRWPVLLAGGKIVWSRRFGAAAEFQATDASRDIVRVSYTASNGSEA